MERRSLAARSLGTNLPRTTFAPVTSAVLSMKIQIDMTLKSKKYGFQKYNNKTVINTNLFLPPASDASLARLPLGEFVRNASDCEQLQTVRED